MTALMDIAACLKGSAGKPGLGRVHHVGATAEGRLGAERSAGVYRRVVWNGAPPSGKVQFRVRLGRETRLYSLRMGL